MLRRLLILLAVVFALPAHAPAHADDFADKVRALNAADFKAKAAAIEALAATGDARALPVLEAMAEGRLYADGNGNVAAVDGAPGPDLTRITVNNNLRGAIRGATGRLGLYAPNPAARLAAAEALLNSPSPAAAEMLRQAVTAETDATVRARMSFVLAALDLSSPDPAHRKASVTALTGSLEPNVRSLLQRMINSEQDTGVRQAAVTALAAIDSRLAALGFGLNIFQGLSLGSVLLLGAIGLAITFGVMGVINMAHGEMIMLGAYTTYVVQEAFRAWAPAGALDFYLVAALPAAFLVSGAVGVALERGVIRFLYGRPLETLLATWGISLMLQQAVRSVFGAPNKEVANPSWMTGGVELMGGAMLTYNRLVIIAFAIAVLLGLAALLRWSSFGLKMRAVTQNRPMAAAMGIPTGWVDALTFGLGSGIAGIAGVALSQIGNVSPNLGQGYIVDAFMVVVFGGVGSLWGTFLGAVSLGLANKFLEPYAGAMLGKILVLVFIILFIQKRPRGLFALKGRFVES